MLIQVRERPAIDAPMMAARSGYTSATRRVGMYLLFAVSLAAFIGGLEYAYAETMAPRFGYLGYIYHEPDRAWMFAAYLLLLATAAFLPFKSDRFSGFAVWFLYAAVVVPVATVPLYNSTRDPVDTFLFSLYCAAVWVFLALIVRRRMPSQVVPVHQLSNAGPLWIVVVVVSVVTYGYVAAVFGITFNIVSLFEVYDTRLEYRGTVEQAGPVVSYLVFNQGNVINPLLMAFGVLRRRWLLVALGVVGQVILYSTAGYKTVLISVPLCIGIALVLRNRQRISGIAIFVCATLLVWGAILVDRIAPSLGVVDIFVSRIFIMAGHLLHFFRDVYDGQPWALWDYSFLAPFVDAPYKTSPGFHVGAVAFGLPEVQANASLFADGFANLGLIGIAIEAAFLAVLLIFVDSASRGLPVALVLPTALLPVFSLANASPFTAFLSLGFALMFLVFALHPRDVGEPGPIASKRRTVKTPA